jgi:hypothetical protein
VIGRLWRGNDGSGRRFASFALLSSWLAATAAAITSTAAAFAPRLLGVAEQCYSESETYDYLFVCFTKIWQNLYRKSSAPTLITDTQHIMHRI